MMYNVFLFDIFEHSGNGICLCWIEIPVLVVILSYRVSSINTIYVLVSPRSMEGFCYFKL